MLVNRLLDELLCGGNGEPFANKLKILQSEDMAMFKGGAFSPMPVIPTGWPARKLQLRLPK